MILHRSRNVDIHLLFNNIDSSPDDEDETARAVRTILGQEAANMAAKEAKMADQAKADALIAAVAKSAAAARKSAAAAASRASAAAAASSGGSRREDANKENNSCSSSASSAVNSKRPSTRGSVQQQQVWRQFICISWKLPDFQNCFFLL